MNTLDLIRPFEAQMIADRRHLHEHPELSGQETETVAYITRALEGLGMSIHVIPNGGVIGVLNERAEGPCVLLRADCDALPIQESEENLTERRCCISKNPGVMHACGHDAHTAMLLAAALVADVIFRTGSGWLLLALLALLALPCCGEQPFPLVSLFCFAHIRRICGREYAVFAFDEKERPVFYPENA